MALLEKLHKDFAEVAEFLYIYIEEAHPEDEWQMDLNVEEGVVFKQPTTMAERMELAKIFVDKMDIETTILVDDIRNTANACYAAWPERIYVIDQEGTIVYKGGMGPFYFNPQEVREFLESRYVEPS